MNSFGKAILALGAAEMVGGCSPDLSVLNRQQRVEVEECTSAWKVNGAAPMSPQDCLEFVLHTHQRVEAVNLPEDKANSNEDTCIDPEASPSY